MKASFGKAFENKGIDRRAAYAHLGAMPMALIRAVELLVRANQWRNRVREAS